MYVYAAGVLAHAHLHFTSIFPGRSAARQDSAGRRKPWVGYIYIYIYIYTNLYIYIYI